MQRSLSEGESNLRKHIKIFILEVTFGENKLEERSKLMPGKKKKKLMPGRQVEDKSRGIRICKYVLLF